MTLEAPPEGSSKSKKKAAGRSTHGLRIAGPGERDSRPEITIGPHVDRMGTTDAAIAALATNDRETFQRGRMLVYVPRVDDLAEAKRTRRQLGAPIICPLERATLGERLHHCARWLRRRGDEWIVSEPPDKIIATVHARRAWKGVPILMGVSETPMLRPDGTVLQTASYDAATGYLYMPTEAYPIVPDRPTQADARDALEQLRLVFQDFPFASPASRMVPIAALLTIVARAAIDGSVPGIVLEASVRASGKTLATDVVAAIATGSAAARTTYPEDANELRKVLDGYALQGAALIGLDNVIRPLGGEALDAYLTARDTVDVRELGKTGQRTVPWRGLIIATGNNVQYIGDTIRRVLVGRLEPDCERPEDRTNFAVDNLIGYVQRARPRLVVAALTVLRAWSVAKRPPMGCARWGSFESWSALVPPAIVYAGGANVLEARLASDTEHDPVAAALSTILAHVPSLDRASVGLRARDIADALYPSGRAPESVDGYGELRDALETITRCASGRSPTSRQIGEALNRLRGRWIGGKRLLGSPSAHDKVMRWRVVAIEATPRSV